MQASEDVPAYWKEHINTRIRDIFQALEAAGENRSAFFWYTDAHWNDNSQRSPQLLRYLSANTPISKTNFGGDIVRLESEDPADMAYLWNWRKAANKVPNHHSVIGNHDDGTRSGASGGFDADYVYSFLLADERTDDIVSGGKFYYYMDDAAEKTRYIYLDTASDDYSFIKNSAQQSFLKETLKSTADGWHIAVIAHIWRDVDYSADPPAENGFSWSGKSVLSVLDAYNARKGEYADCGAWVEFCIGGHTHADGNFASDGGIPVVITETDSYQLRSGLNYASGTISEAAVSAVIADYNAGKLHIIRIGRGSSRTVSLKKHE